MFGWKEPAKPSCNWLPFGGKGSIEPFQMCSASPTPPTSYIIYLVAWCYCALRHHPISMATNFSYVAKVHREHRFKTSCRNVIYQMLCTTIIKRTHCRRSTRIRHYAQLHQSVKNAPFFKPFQGVQKTKHTYVHYMHHEWQIVDSYLIR